MNPNRSLCENNLCDGLIWCLSCCNLYIGDNEESGYYECWCCGCKCSYDISCVICMLGFPCYYWFGDYASECRACFGKDTRMPT